MGILTDIYSADERTTRFDLPTPNKYIDSLYHATSIGHEYIRREYYLKRVGQDLFMVNYIVNGEAHMSFGDRYYRLKKGDLCFLHLVPQNIFYPAGDGLEIYFFHILGGQLRTVYKNFVEEMDGNVLHDFPAENVSKLYDVFLDTMGKPDFFYASSKAIGNFLTDVLQLSTREEKAKYPQIIENIILQIRNAEPTTSVGQIAEYFGYNPIYLERLFKEQTGETLYSQIMQCKYNLACNLLLTTDLTVEAIAQKLGYADAKGLICLFKKIGGSTPNAFRKQKRK